MHVTGRAAKKSLTSLRKLLKNHETSEKNAFRAYKRAVVTALMIIVRNETILPPINTFSIIRKMWRIHKGRQKNTSPLRILRIFRIIDINEIGDNKH